MMCIIQPFTLLILYCTAVHTSLSFYAHLLLLRNSPIVHPRFRFIYLPFFMPSRFHRPKFLDDYHGGTPGMSTLEACIRSLRSAMSIKGRPVYADHRYNFAIDDLFPSEVNWT